jgi:serine/threonine protein kinase
VNISAPPPSPLVPGLKLDRYELICPIAEGGMASVWIARQTGKHGFQRLVAVKTILPKYACDSRFQTMFLDEVRIASRIEHDNVTQIVDVGEQHDTTYLVMEYVDGEALSTIHRQLKKKGARMPAGVLLRIMADVCGGLHAAHELRDEDGQLLGVVHRDVSPQNVLVTASGDAKLIDFGIAKARDRIAADTSTGTLKGKVRYMAPEQAVGGEVDRRADIWAIGAMLYDLLSGKAPYESENDVQTLLALMSGRPPAPLPSTIHPAIQAVVRRALVAAPSGRFATAAEMQQAIEESMIEAKVATGTAAVASFILEHVADRMHQRKQSIQLGLRAATARETYATLMRSNVTTTGTASSGGSVVGHLARHPADVSSVVSPSTKPDETLGSAALEVRDRSRQTTRTVRWATLSGAAFVVVCVVALLARRASEPLLGASAAGTMPSAAQATERPRDTAPTPLPAPAQQFEIPGAARPTGLDHAAAPSRALVTTSSPASVGTTRSAPRPAASVKPARSTKPRVDDGF